MVRKKSQSKRMSCSQRFKITKRAAEKHRKDRREAKKNPRTRKTKKDPGIPNNWPFKEQLLNQIEEEKIKEAESKERNKRLCQRLQKKAAAAEAKAKSVDTVNAEN